MSKMPSIIGLLSARVGHRLYDSNSTHPLSVIPKLSHAPNFALLKPFYPGTVTSRISSLSTLHLFQLLVSLNGSLVGKGGESTKVTLKKQTGGRGCALDP
uniref:Uncharacterized protein n=1 Tax=Octopus bimaculoides TaxID=37653 RepID=A0A0L8HZ60_OCTBM